MVYINNLEVLNGKWTELTLRISRTITPPQKNFTIPSHLPIHTHINTTMGAAANQGAAKAHWEQISVKCLAKGNNNGLGGSKREWLNLRLLDNALYLVSHSCPKLELEVLKMVAAFCVRRGSLIDYNHP